jgi:hypothetical protein
MGLLNDYSEFLHYWSSKVRYHFAANVFRTTRRYFFSKYKEPNFYTFEGQKLPEKGPVSPALLYKLCYSYCVTDFDSYEQQFSAHANEKAVGDESVRNLYYPESAQRIFKRVLWLN